MHLLSPEIDWLTEASRRWSNAESASAEVFERFNECYGLLRKIEPRRAGNDSVWSLWIRTERGRLADFGDYDEYREVGEVGLRKKFEELWRMEYPDEI